MRRDSPKTFKKLLKNPKKSVIVTHWSPDGDAMGSSLALFHYLNSIGHKTSLIVPNAYPDFLSWLPGNNRVINFSSDEAKARKIITSADLIFTLDFNSYKRLEKLGDLLHKSPAPKIMIDHHQQPDDYAAYYYHDAKACSTCELIYDLIADLGDSALISKKIAACLYTGIMTDTGSFRYPSVTTRTHLIISELLKTGIVPSDIHSAVYDNYSLNRLKLLGYALNEKLRLIEGYPVAYFTLSEKELKKFNYKKGDTEGLVNYPFSIKGIQVCALLNENEGVVKVSLRSKGRIDVNKFAREYFSGGGHINAAGGRDTESLARCETKFINSVKTLFQ
jgi:bifunctional oligoribonuclease and PAP phosphatase NrnA